MGETVQDPQDTTTAAEGNGSGPAGEAEERIEQGLVIEGSHGQLTMTIGGKSPTEASLRLMGGKIKVEGEFRKGDRITFHGTAVVNEVGVKDDEDSKTGQVVGAERRHRARVTELHAQKAA